MRPRPTIPTFFPDTRVAGDACDNQEVHGASHLHEIGVIAVVDVGQRPGPVVANVHAAAFETPCRFAADAAQADDPDLLSRHPGGERQEAQGPAAGTDETVGRGDSTGHVQQKRHHQIGDVLGGDGWCVGHQYVARAGRLKVDPVGMVSRDGDDLEAGKGIDQPGVGAGEGRGGHAADALGDLGKDGLAVALFRQQVDREVGLQSSHDRNLVYSVLD